MLFVDPRKPGDLGTIYSRRADSGFNRDLNDYQGKFKKSNGDILNSQINLNNSYAKSQQDVLRTGSSPGTSSDTPTQTVGSASKVIPETNTAPSYLNTAQTVMNLTPEVATSLDDSFKSLNDHVMKYYNDPNTRSNPTFYVQRDGILDGIARKISDAQFNSNKSLQSQIGPADVEKTNAEWLKRAAITDAINQGIPFSGAFIPKTDIASKLVKTPADVYYQRQAPIIKKQLAQLETTYMANADKINNATIHISNRTVAGQKIGLGSPTPTPTEAPDTDNSPDDND